MARALVRIGIAVLLSGASSAQGPSPPPAFDTADIHVSPPSKYPGMTHSSPGAGRYELRNGTVVELISLAYHLPYRQLIGGPEWLDLERFDVIAKRPPSTPPETERLMLQTLLADRFQLKVHTAMQPVPQYALMLGPGAPLLKPADGKGPVGCEERTAPSSTMAFSCRNTTMAAFAAMTVQFFRNGNHPVRDLTGLKGAWDFDFKTTEYYQLPAAGPDAVTIFDAVEKQLGLKL